MGILKQGILGGFSGKVANIVGSSWKGLAVVKAMPLSVANPKTAAQIAQRTKFSNVVALATLILTSVIKPFWDRFAQYMSGYNAFIKENIDNFDADGVIDPELMIFSKGKMASSPIGTTTLSESSQISSVDWGDDSGNGYKLSSDVVKIIFYNVTQNFFIVGASSLEPITRDATHFSTDNLSGFVEGDSVYVYMIFRRADGTIVSNTSFRQFIVEA